MNFNRILLLFLCLFVTGQIMGQTSKVSGVVMDENENPVEFANIFLTNGNSSKINGAVSQENGSFELQANKNNYKLTVSSIGYETYETQIEVNGGNVDLGKIILKPDMEMLGAAVVTAKLIDRKADRFVMNVAGNPSAAGKNTVELLALAPSVWVDKQKGISINGKSDIKVMINDRIMKMSSDELMNYLETIPSEDIQNIEIITDPGAEYEADSNSGILHIKLKKGRESGLTGSLSMGYGIATNGKPRYSPSLNFNYRRNKLSLYGSGYYNYGGWKSDDVSDANFYDQNRETHTETDRDQTSSYLRVNLGTVYEINDKHDIGLTFETGQTPYYKNEATSLFRDVVNGIVGEQQNSTYLNDWNIQRYDASMNYKFKVDTLGSFLKFFVDYTWNRSNDDFFGDMFTNNQAAPDSSYRTFMTSKYDLYALRLDYLKKFNERTSVSFGGRYGYAEMNYTSKQDYKTIADWINNPLQQDDYTYNENIAALYGKFDSKWKNLSYTLGLRYEHTSLNIAKEYKPSYNDLFPSVFLKYTIKEDKGHSVTASYNRKLSRPYYSNFNPFREWSSDGKSYFTGNPYLKPTYSDAFGLTATLFDKLVLTVNYTIYNDVVTQIVQAAPEPGISMQTLENVEKMRQFYASAYLPVKVTNWYSFTAQMNVSRSKYDLGFLTGQPWVLRGNTQHTFTLPKNWTISIDGWFGTKSSWGILEVTAMGGINGSINKKMFDNKLVASFNWWNIQGQRHATITSKYDNYSMKSRQLNQTQVLNFSLTYNFSRGKKVEVKTVESGVEESRL